MLQKTYICELILLFLFCLNSITAHTESKEIRFRNIDTEASFPNKEVRAIIQDSLGYLWFGTYESLIRFNGIGYKVFENKKDDPTSLASSNAFALYIDNEKQLWVGGSGGVSKFIPECECFESIKSHYFTENTTYSIDADENNNLWFGTDSGLFKLDYISRKVSQEITKTKITYIKTVGDLIYMGSELDGLYIGSISSGKLINTINERNYPIYDSIGRAVLEFTFDPRGDIWFATSNGGAYKYDVDKDSLVKFQIFEKDKAPKQTIFCVSYIDDENILWGIQNGGLLQHNYRKNTFRRYASEKEKPFSLQSNTIRTIFCDRDDNFWIGTHLSGVYYFNAYDLDLEYFYPEQEIKNGLTFNIISSFTEDSRGNIWIGTDGGYLHKYAPDLNTFEVFDSIAGLPSKNITDVIIDHRNNLWIAAWHDALVRMDQSTGIIDTMFFKTNEWNTRRSWNDFKGLFHDSRNRTWAFPIFKSPLIFEGGIIYSSDIPGPYPPELFKLSLTIDAAEDSLGGIWIYGFDELAYIDSLNNLKTFEYNENDKGSILSSSVMNIMIDSKNRAWISSFNGLELFDYISGTFQHISQKYGLPEEIYSLQEDGKGYLWFTSPQGLGRFHPDTMNVQFFKKNIGIKGGNFISRSGFTSSTGHIYFGGTKGFVRFHPDSLKPNQAAPEVLITNFLLYNRKVNYKDSTGLLDRPIYITDTITVSHNQNMLGFTFAALNFVSPKDNTYAYRLVHFDKNWNYIGKNNSATYTNLDPGTYRLEVKATNNEGIWSNKIKKLTIIVTPPWWATWWFRISFVLIASTIIGAVFYARMLQVKRINKRLEQMVKERTSELKKANDLLILQKSEIEKQRNEIETQNKSLIEKSEEIISQQEELRVKNSSLEELNKTKDKFFSIIAHDLKNPLNAILGLADLLSKSFERFPDEKKKKFAFAIADSTKLLYSLIENLLHWARAQSGRLPFEPKPIRISSLIDKNIKTLFQHARNKNIKLFYASTEDISFTADSNMVDTVIRNLLSNAIKYTNDGGYVAITAKVIDQKYIQVEIKDSGIGMDEKRLNNLFKIGISNSRNGTNNETGTGLGLILCKEFVENHKGEIWAESEVKNGTTFFIRLPLLQE